LFQRTALSHFTPKQDIVKCNRPFCFATVRWATSLIAHAVFT
jgi:hypothetical protein